MLHLSMKNVPHKAALSRIAHFAAVGVLAISLAGCSLLPQQVAAPAVPSSGQGVYGTGEKFDTVDGSFEQVKMNPNDPVYKYDQNRVSSDFTSRNSWSVDDITEAQKLSVDYVGNEFLNSSVLENGREAFNYWFQNRAGIYFSPTIMDQVAGDPNTTHIILGNFGEKPMIPELIHDGTPRVKDVKLTLTGVTPHDSDPANRVSFYLDWQADYRVNDANGAKIVGYYTDPVMTGDEVINSKYAKDSLKDGVGENVYRGKGSATITVVKEESGMKIIGFTSKADFDTSAFSTLDEK